MASHCDNYIKERNDTIIKSKNDNRLYRGLVLANKLKVLLISDPSTDKSAAALDVNIGCMFDPYDLPGLANLCKHILFLGTTRDLKKSCFYEYLHQNRGCADASVDLDHTVYKFEIIPYKLFSALERFAQLFEQPIFTEYAFKEALDLIDSEYYADLANDVRRCIQLNKSFAKRDHPFCRFHLGNRKTLEIIPEQKGIDVRGRLYEFYHRYYSSDLMSLCVLGRETLDELERTVVSFFSKISDMKVKIPQSYPFMDKELGTKINIVPVKYMRKLIMIFRIPDLRIYYQFKPIYYFSYLLEHEGRGSLLSVLKNKNWCSSLVCEERDSFKGLNLFVINIELSKEGFQHVDNIIYLVFQYLKMLKKQGPNKWIYQEYQELAEKKFKFLDKSTPVSYVASNARALQMYPMDDVLHAESIFSSDWNPSLIDKLSTKFLIPSNMKVYLVAKENSSIANVTEPWYSIKYSKERIPKELINEWNIVDVNLEFFLPPKNDFKVMLFEIKKASDNLTRAPTVIRHTPSIKAWFQQNLEVPKAKMIFYFVKSFTYMDAMNCALNAIFVELLRESVIEYIHAAKLAGLETKFANHNNGITLTLDGYDEKQHILLEKIMISMTNLKVDPKKFEVCKETYRWSVQNFDAVEIYEQAIHCLEALLTEQTWTADDLVEIIDYITVDRMEQFIRQFLDTIHVECLIFGNTTVGEVINVTRKIESRLPSAPHIKPAPELCPLISYRQLELLPGWHFIFEKSNSLSNISCTLAYYQSGIQSMESDILLHLLVQIISKLGIETLRFQEQLGYVVIDVHKMNGIQGLKILVQSNKHKPAYIERRINILMYVVVKKYLSTMSDEQLETHKEIVKQSYLNLPELKNARFAKYWDRILMQQHYVGQIYDEFTYLSNVTRKKLFKFYKEIIFSVHSRRKLSVHIKSTITGDQLAEKNELKIDNKCEESDIYAAEKSIYIIDNILHFQSRLYSYPLIHESDASLMRKEECMREAKLNERHDNIIKSGNDKRLYRSLVFANKLKVLLISDPTTEKSAAAMNINTGYLDDPNVVPGLAHLCQHMLPKESKKYAFGNYEAYVSFNKGRSGGSTIMDHTIYYFDVHTNKLWGALDRFAQIFIEPILSRTRIEEAVKTIEWEYMNNLLSNMYIYDQFSKSPVNPHHAYTKFGLGNQHTLETVPKRKRIDVWQKLRKFHEDHYSADIMSLCVLGKEDLNELEEMVVNLFYKIPNKNIQSQKRYYNPFYQDHYGHTWYTISTQNTRALLITFPVSLVALLHSYVHLKEYEYKPTVYVSHILQREGKNSLLSSLKDLGWCEAITCRERAKARGFLFYDIRLDLTESGVKNIESIVYKVFHYILQLQQTTAVKWIFEEYKSIADMRFRFKEKSSPHSYVISCAHALQLYSVYDVLRGGHVFSKYNEELINRLLKILSPANAKVHVIGTDNKDATANLNYRTEYKKIQIESSVHQLWAANKTPPDPTLLDISLKNEFIASDFDIKLNDTEITEFPKNIIKTSYVTLWFKKSKKFFIPETEMIFLFVRYIFLSQISVYYRNYELLVFLICSAFTSVDPISFNLSHIYVRLLNLALNEYAYDIHAANLRWKICVDKRGIQLTLSGYNDKKHVLLEKILDRMLYLTIEQKTFETVQRNYISALRDLSSYGSHKEALHYLQAILMERTWISDELLDATEHLTIEALAQFKNQFFNKMHVECLIYGNMTKAEAESISKLIESKLKSTMPHLTPLLSKHLILRRAIRLEKGINYLLEVLNSRKKSCTLVYYQAEKQTIESNIWLELLKDIITPLCVNIFKFDEECNDIIVKDISGTQGLMISIEGIHETTKIEKRMDAFMKFALKYIDNMSEEKFEKHKKMVITKYCQEPTTLNSMAAAYWDEIYNRQYNFKRRNMDVEYLEHMKQDQLINLFETMALGGRKLSVHVISTRKNISQLSTYILYHGSQLRINGKIINGDMDEATAKEKVKIIDNIMLIQNSQFFNPLLQPSPSVCD